MNDCIFCNIIQKESPSFNFYEDENFIGVLSIHPLNKGHALIIPKVHYRWVWDYPVIGIYFEVVQKIVAALKKSLNTDFIIGAQVGDEVHHAHVALIPRFENDGHGDFLDPNLSHKFSDEEMIRIAELIKNNL